MAKKMRPRNAPSDEVYSAHAIIAELEEQLAERTAALERIGQGLHDSVGQELAGLSLLMDNLSESLTDADSKKRCQHVGSRLREVLRQIRALVRGSMAIEVSRDGLAMALAELAERINEQTQVRCTFHCDGTVLLKDVKTATHLFHIAQEAVHNALSHGQPKTTEIRLLLARDVLTLIVEDDGIGVAGKMCNQGSGLRIMHHRASLIQGVVDVSPREGAGTRMICSLKIGSDHEQETKAGDKAKHKSADR